MDDNPQRHARSSLPPTMSVRDFLRGGYQQLDRPTVIFRHSEVLGTWVPGAIDSRYSWSPGSAPRSNSAPLIPTTQMPGWLQPPARKRKNHAAQEED